jgi:hypothetical protein
MYLTSINYLAVFVSACFGFLIGWLWYAVLFTKSWLREHGLEEVGPEKIPIGFGKLFFGAFTMLLIIAFTLAIFLSRPSNLLQGFATGALVSVGLVGAAIGMNYIFERKSMKLFLITAGYHVITLSVMGAIIGVWK